MEAKTLKSVKIHRNLEETSSLDVHKNTTDATGKRKEKISRKASHRQTGKIKWALYKEKKGQNVTGDLAERKSASRNTVYNVYGNGDLRKFGWVNNVV